MARAQKKTGGRKREKKNVPVGSVHIQSTFNNTIVTVTDSEGNALAWSSSGSRGFKGAKKGTAYAAQIAAETALRKAMDSGLREVASSPAAPAPARKRRSAQWPTLA